MGLRPGPRQQAGREVTPLGDPGGEAAKSRARHGSLRGWGAAPERGSVVASVMMVAVLLCSCCSCCWRWCRQLYMVVEQGSRWCGAGE